MKKKKKKRKEYQVLKLVILDKQRHFKRYSEDQLIVTAEIVEFKGEIYLVYYNENNYCIGDYDAKSTNDAIEFASFYLNVREPDWTIVN
jgi:hypothetical protein